MVKQMRELKYEGRTSVLFHYPVTEWNGFYYRAVHLYGHQRSHVAMNYRDRDNGLLRCDVGVDTNTMVLASIQEIIALSEQHISVLGVHSTEEFEELSQGEQRRIIDAGMEAFGRYKYKEADTGDIAVEADISKGLLLYCFRGKKSFYMYLLQYCVTIVIKTLDDEDFTRITDLFVLMKFGAQKEMQIVVERPFILDFICRAFSSRCEAASNDMAMELHFLTDMTFDRFFAHVGFPKFSSDADSEQVYQILVWMTERYMHEKFSRQETPNLENTMKDPEEWKVMFRKMAHKRGHQ